MTSPRPYLEGTSTTGESSESLLAALAKARIPAANHQFIQQLTAAVGIAEYRAVVETDKPHVVAKRRDGLPDLHIHYGYTNGFRSAEEVTRLLGARAGAQPSSRKGTWYVEHPVNRVRNRGERTKDVRRQAGFCTCGMQLSLTGICDICD